MGLIPAPVGARFRFRLRSQCVELDPRARGRERFSRDTQRRRDA